MEAQVDAQAQVIQRTLEGLSNLKDELALRELQFRELRESAVPEEVRQALAEIDAEAESVLTPLQQAIAREETRVKDAVAAYGQSVRGGGLHAIYSKPRVTWDSKRLDGYAAAHPEIEAFRKVGRPSVSIRVVDRE